MSSTETGNLNILTDAMSLLEASTPSRNIVLLTEHERENLKLRPDYNVNPYGFYNVLLKEEWFGNDIPNYFLKIKNNKKTKKKTSNVEKANYFNELTEKYYNLNKVHFRRYYDDNCRRPFVKLPHGNMAILCRDIFFNNDGSLKVNFLKEVVADGTFHFIKFDKSLTQIDDFRFMMQFKQDSEAVKILLSILTDNKVVDKYIERIHGVALIFGGTLEQAHHYDMSRNYTSFYKIDKKHSADLNKAHNYEAGWEVNREAYNNAMMMSNAHTSILIDVSNEQKGFKIGIPTSYLEFKEDDKKASIKKGDDEFEVCQTETKTTTINVSGGCQFVGDFVHCGADNVTGIASEVKFRELMKAIETIKNSGSAKMKEVDNILKMFQAFKGLNNFCRLFLATDPLVNNPVVSAANVGIVVDDILYELNYMNDTTIHQETATPTTESNYQSAESAESANSFDCFDEKNMNPENSDTMQMNMQHLFVSGEKPAAPEPAQAIDPEPDPMTAPPTTPTREGNAQSSESTHSFDCFDNKNMYRENIDLKPINMEQVYASDEKPAAVEPAPAIVLGHQKEKVSSNRKASLRSRNTPSRNVKVPPEAIHRIMGNTPSEKSTKKDPPKTPLLQKRKNLSTTSLAEGKQKREKIDQQSTKKQSKIIQKEQSKKSLKTSLPLKIISKKPKLSKERELYRVEKKARESSTTPAISTVPSTEFANETKYHGFFEDCCEIDNYVTKCAKAKTTEALQNIYKDLKSHIKDHVVLFRRGKFDMDINKEEVKTPAEIDHTFPFFRVLLLKKNFKNKQRDIKIEWFEIKRSNLKAFGPHSRVRLGVFAAQDFKKFECLGLYMGMIKNKDVYTKYSAESLFGNVDANNSFYTGAGQPVYGMGIGEVNDPTQENPFDENFDLNKAEAKINTFLTHELLLYATRDINRGEELFLKYKQDNEQSSAVESHAV